MDIFKDHPFLVGCDIVEKICQPLFKKYGINYFCHIRAFKDDHYTGVMSDKRWARHYLKNKYYNIDVPSYDLDKIKSGVDIWCDTKLDKQIEKIYKDACRFGYGIGFSLIFNNDGVCDFFSFATKNNKAYLHKKIIPNLDDFKKFVYHYLESLKINKELKELYAKKYRFNRIGRNKVYKLASNRAAFSIIDDISERRFYFSIAERNMYLTYREVQCLKYLIKEKTLKDVAQSLEISTRTVESYIGNIKLKMGCKSLSQIRESVMPNAYILTAIDLVDEWAETI